MYNGLERARTCGETRSGSMGDFGNARSIPSEAPQDVPSAEALYNQGMAYYRRRQWQKARESFQQLKRVDPGRRGIDALLDELDIFIRLESLEPAPLLQEVPTAEPEVPAPVVPKPAPLPEVAPTLRAWPRWLLPVGLLAIVGLAAAVFFIFGRWNVRGQIDELRNRGQAYRIAGNWTKAIEAYEQLLVLVPEDLEAKNGLWIAYYERGDQRSADGQRFEERGQYAEAAEQWEGAIADFQAAQEVQPDHRPDPRGAIKDRIAVAEQHAGWAKLFAQAEQLKQDRRWTEAVETLQTLQKQAPDYRSTEVRTALSECYLGAGEDAISKADGVPPIQAGIKLIEQAFTVQPSNSQVQEALQRARDYLQAVTSFQDGQWGDAIQMLEPLVKEAPTYAGGRAREALCQAYSQRAEESVASGKLREAQADYEAMLALGACTQRVAAAEKATQVAVALTPTVTPTPSPTRRPTATPIPTATPVPTATPEPSPTPYVPPTQEPSRPKPTKDPRQR